MAIFFGSRSYDVARSLVRQAQARAKSLSEAEVSTIDIDKYAAQLIKELVPERPKLLLDQVENDRREGNTGPGYHETTHYLEIYLPFDGPHEVFNMQPSACRMNGLPFELRHGGFQNQELVYRTGIDDGRAREKFMSEVAEIERHLDTLQYDFGAVPEQIREVVTNAIFPRRQSIDKAKVAAANLGFKMRRRDDAPETYIAPQVQRKITPANPEASAVTKAEPVLAEEEYQHIMKVMDNMTHVMERSPKVFKDLGEEDIRTHFLIQLNGQYEGQATGETFNAAGKTDIMIRVDDKNIFIGECKFWGGEKLLGETIDQLLGYLTWRDAKTALVIFNRNKGLTTMVEKAVAAVKKHASYKGGPMKEGDTRYRYIMGNKNDPDKDVTMTLMIYDVPTA